MKKVLFYLFRYLVIIALLKLYFEAGKFVINKLPYSIDTLNVISYLFFASYLFIAPLCFYITKRITEV